MTTHCQICGRAIKASKGLIAHHGYTRKGGWQTASCFGARFRPYEVACDAIQLAIDSATAWRQKRTEWLANHVANPPAQITYNDARGSYRAPVMKTVDRPADFNFERDCRGGYRFDQKYAMQYADLKHSTERSIKQVSEEIEFMQDRLAKWTGE